MSLAATYFNSVINYKFCFQNVTENELKQLKDFLEDKFDEDVYDLAYSEFQYTKYIAIWLKFYNQENELKFKLLWKDFH